MPNKITSLIKQHLICLLLVSVLPSFVGCSSDSNEYHPEDKELAPVDWSKWNRSELYLQIRQGNVDKVRELIQRDPSLIFEKSSEGSGSAIFEAVRQGEYLIVSILAENGADVNEQLEFIDYNSPNIPRLDMRGYTPLHLSVENEDEKMVKLLIGLGASLDSTYEGKTALHLAQEKNAATLVTVLEHFLERTEKDRD